MSNKIQIFISYSHRDKRWLEILKISLRQLVRDAELKIWSDTDIQLSSDWYAEIKRALFDANVAILLISPNFLASDFIASEELPQLLIAADQRGLRIFPVYMSSCFLPPDSHLLKYQGPNSPDNPLDLMDEGNQNFVLTKLVKSIYELITINAKSITEEWLSSFRSRFVPVIGDSFTMGDNELHQEDNSNALREQKVQVVSFHMGQYVVTQSEWIALTGTQPWLSEKSVVPKDEIPAVCVNVSDIMNFLAKLNKADPKFSYRLPTEAEWEYAARGGQATKDVHLRFSFSNDENYNDENKLIEYGWHDRNASSIGDAYPHPVGQLKPNQLKLFDMHGNVWEWLLDHNGSSYVVHGGGFNAKAIAASSAYRIDMKPENKGVALGFRLVQEPR